MAAKMAKPELKRLAHRVIVAQGNFFIKELLRSSGAKIGTTKEDFAKNLDAAIDADLITQDIRRLLCDPDPSQHRHR